MQTGQPMFLASGTICADFAVSRSCYRRLLLLLSLLLLLLLLRPSYAFRDASEGHKARYEQDNKSAQLLTR